MSFTPSFTTSDLVAEVRRLAAEDPDHVYRPPVHDVGEENPTWADCSYVTGEDGKGCLIGQALSNLGVPFEELVKFEGYNVVMTLGLMGLVDEDHVSDRAAHTDEECFLMRVQYEQDDSRPWGEAVESAEWGTE